MKSDKKETIKQILNIDNDSDDNTKSPSHSDNFTKTGNSSTEISKEKNDIPNNLSTTRESDSHNESSSSQPRNDNNRTSSNVNNFILDIAVLNEISRACQLAMNNISFLSTRVCDKEMRKQLVAIYSQYSNIFLQVSQHFEKYGEIPANVPNSVKIMGMTGIRMNTKFDRSSSHIAEIMIQGENMGIIKCQKILNMHYDVHNSTRKLLETFKDFQIENISTLSHYL